MNSVVKQIKKWQPYFDAFAANKYVSGMRNGLILPMYVLIFSSIFMVITYVPNIWGFHWPENIEMLLLKPYDLTMGIYGLIVSATVAKAFTDILNQEQAPGKKISYVATMVTTLSAFLILLTDPAEGALSTSFLGASGMIVGIILGLIIPNIYKFCVNRNLTIKLPKEVPPNLSESFASLISYGLAIFVIWAFDIVFRYLTGGQNIGEVLLAILNPIFRAAETYVGMGIIYAATAFFQFLGMNGPDIVFPAVKPAMFQFLAENQELYRQGLQASHAMTNSSYDMAVAFGGTGATLMVTLMFAFLSKSEKNKAVGKAAIVPVLFNVNEPITFGVPLILNPMFLIPFILTPVVNTFLLKFFISGLGMNGFIMEVPWTTPGFIGTILGTNFHPLSFLLVLVVMVTNSLLYYPFFKAYDMESVEEEAKMEEGKNIVEKEEVVLDRSKVKDDKINVLVLCAGGGTSGMLANALNDNKDKLKEKYGVEFSARGGHYGQHNEFMNDTDIVVLAPQVSSFLENMEKEAGNYGIKVIATKGAEYIKYTRDSESAAELIIKELNK